MMRSLAAVALVLAAALAPSAQTEPVHTFQVRDGAIYLDGRLLPDAVPDGLDLSGENTRVMEFSGPIAPVLEVDGRAYVLENGRLVALSETSSDGQGVYFLGDAMPTDPEEAVASLPQDRVTPIVEAAYMRDVASRNSALYNQMRREHTMEGEVGRLTSRVLGLAPGPERSGLRRQLRGLLSELLTLKHEIRAEEIAVAEQQLEAARQALAARRGHHDQIVDGRLRELVGDE